VDFWRDIAAVEQSTRHLWEKPRTMRAVFGLPNGTIATNRTGYYWVQLLGETNQPVQAYWAGDAFRAGTPVYVAVDIYRAGGAAPYTILGTVAAVGTVMGPAQETKSQLQDVAGKPAEAYEWTRFNLGHDPLSVHERALSSLRAQPQETASLYLDVLPGSYLYGQSRVGFDGGVSPVFSPPGAGVRLDVLYLDCSTGELAIETGTAATVITEALDLPTIPSAALPLCAVTLHADDTAVSEDMVYDLRPTWTVPGPRFVPLPTPATSASWDGDAKNGASGTIDLSAVFSLPAGIKGIFAKLAVRDETVGVIASLRTTSGTDEAIVPITQVADVIVADSGFCPCDTNGDVYFYQSGEVDNCYLTIFGYLAP